MQSYRQVDRYHQVAVETADQKELILICYDEAIRALQQGIACYQAKRYVEKARLLIRAQDFISELLVSLNMEAGGQIARNLKSIYQFVIEQITLADVKRNPKRLSDLIGLLTELRSAWAQIEFRPTAEVLPSQPYGQAVQARGFTV